MEIPLSVDFTQPPPPYVKVQLVTAINNLLRVYFDQNTPSSEDTSFVAFIFSPFKEISPEGSISKAEINGKTELLVNAYKTMTEKNVLTFLQKCYATAYLLKRQEFKDCAFKFVTAVQEFFDFVKNNENLLQYTLRNKSIQETLQLKLRGYVTDLADTDVCNIMVMGPNEAGTFFLHMSEADLDSFKKFASTTIMLQPMGARVAHALILTYNKQTQSCHIYDPNGRLENTNFPETTIRGFVKAVHRGLLRPLLQEPFAVSFQSFSDGLQNREGLNSQILLIKLLDYNYHNWLPVETKGKLINYLVAEGGFCVTWSIFMVVDNCKCNLACYTLIESAFVYKRTESRDVFNSIVELFWLKKFCAELGVKYEGKPPDAVRKLLREMALPLFVRLLAQYFLDQNAMGTHLGQEQRWWPDLAENTSSNVVKNMKTLFGLITPSGPLLDMEKKFDTARRKLFKSRFPFVHDGTDKKIFAFSVDAENPIERQRAEMQ